VISSKEINKSAGDESPLPEEKISHNRRENHRETDQTNQDISIPTRGIAQANSDERSTERRC
jgi:hypothetical protein